MTMTSLARRVVLAMECDDRTEPRAILHAGPTVACAALGSVVGHVVRVLLRDRRLLASWLDGRESAA